MHDASYMILFALFWNCRRVLSYQAVSYFRFTVLPMGPPTSFPSQAEHLVPAASKHAKYFMTQRLEKGEHKFPYALLNSFTVI